MRWPRQSPSSLGFSKLNSTWYGALFGRGGRVLDGRVLSWDTSTVPDTNGNLPSLDMSSFALSVARHLSSAICLVVNSPLSKRRLASHGAN